MANTNRSPRHGGSGRRARLGSAELLERNQEIVRRVRSGERVAAVAKDYGISKWAVYKILPPDVERPGGQGDYPREVKVEQRAQVMHLVDEMGMSYREVGQRLGLSHARVGEIVRSERSDGQGGD